MDINIKDKAKSILLENINIEGLAFGMIDDILEEALMEVVADTDNPFDDVMMASIYQPLEDMLKLKISERITVITE